MKAIIFLSTDELIDYLMELYTAQQATDIDEDDEIYKRVYAESLYQIEQRRMDYPYLQRTKKFGCWVV